MRAASGWKQRTLIFLLGFLVFAGILEVALRVAGNRAYPRPGALSPAPDGTFTILCAGDSFTAGQGDARYPDQLEALLRARGHTVSVVNAGIGGGNTAMIREALPGFLRDVHPDLVLLLAGTTNQTSYYGYSAFLGSHSWVSRVDDALFNVRIWRFSRYLATALRRRPTSAPRDLTGVLSVQADQRGSYARLSLMERDDALFQQGRDQLDAGDVNGAIAAFRSYADAQPQDPAGPWNVAVAMESRYPVEAPRWYDACLDVNPSEPACLVRFAVTASTPAARTRATDLLRTASRTSPENPDFHWALGLLAASEGRNDGAIPELVACIRYDPDNPTCYDTLGTALHTPAQRDQARAFLHEISDASPLAWDFLQIWGTDAFSFGHAEDPRIAAWVRGDLAAMVDQIREHGCPLVLQSYPFFNPLNTVIAGVADTRGVPYVDQQAAFEKLGRDGRDRLKAPDGHCNREGYGWMARHVADAMEGWGLLPQ